jgi:hypothetical protein
MRVRRLSTLFAFMAISAALWPPAALAGFVSSVTGAAAVVSAPADSSPGQFEADNLYHIWEESSGKLGSALTLDMGGTAGSYDGLSAFPGITLPKDTSYAATMIHFDPQTSSPAQSPIATVTFTSRIIGLALFGTSLDASDIYAHAATIYPHGLPNLFLQTRGIDFTHTDRFTISADGKTLSLQLTGGLTSIDQIRVFTTFAGVPEPSTLIVWCGIALVVAAGSRRRRILDWYANCPRMNATRLSP